MDLCLCDLKECLGVKGFNFGGDDTVVVTLIWSSTVGNLIVWPLGLYSIWRMEISGT